MAIELPTNRALESVNKRVVVHTPFMKAITIAGRGVADNVYLLIRLLGVVELVAEPHQLVAWIGDVSE